MKEFANLSDDKVENVYGQISQNIKIIRKNKKLTQSEVALSMGLTTPTFYTNAESFKRGKHFNLEHIIRIANILEVDIKDFFEDIEIDRNS